MPAYPLRALVLRKTKLGEADLIVTLLASDGRQVRAVAKGARKPKSRFGGRVEPYTELDLLLHTGRSLEVIAEASTVEAHEGLREDLDRGAHAAVVAGLLDKVSVEGEGDPRVYGLALATLEPLETAEVDDLLAVTVAFLVKVMAMLGYRPELDTCVSCGTTPGVALFALEEGGVVCAACGATEPGVLPISDAATAALRALLRARMADVPALGLPSAVQTECFALMRAFVAAHVPAHLKALDYLASWLG